MQLRRYSAVLILAATYVFTPLTAKATPSNVSDILIEFFNAATGVSLLGDELNASSVSNVLGNTSAAFAIRAGNFVTVGFTEIAIFDGAGSDLFLTEVGADGATANIFVSSSFSTNSADFVFLGVAGANRTSFFDLASIGFTEAVRAVRVQSLSNGGSAPGFDLTRVGGVNFAEIPEPPSLALMGLGFLGLGAQYLRRRRLSSNGFFRRL